MTLKPHIFIPTCTKYFQKVHHHHFILLNYTTPFCHKSLFSYFEHELSSFEKLNQGFLMKNEIKDFSGLKNKFLVKYWKQIDAKWIQKQQRANSATDIKVQTKTSYTIFKK